MVRGLGLKMGDTPKRKKGMAIDSEFFTKLEYIVKGNNLIINDYRSGAGNDGSSGTITVAKKSMKDFIEELTGIYETYFE